MSTLITAANSAEAQQLKNILPNNDVILGDYQDVPEMFIKSGKILVTPDPKSVAFIHQMLAFCLDRQIDKLFVLRREELLQLAEAHQLFDEFDIKLMVPSKETVLTDNLVQRITDGNIVIIENGQVIKGDILNEDILLKDKIQNGVFKVSKNTYTIFTAD